MLDNNSPIDALVTGVTGTAGLLSKLISRKFALIAAVVTLAVTISTLVFG